MPERGVVFSLQVILDVYLSHPVLWSLLLLCHHRMLIVTILNPNLT